MWRKYVHVNCIGVLNPSLFPFKTRRQTTEELFKFSSSESSHLTEQTLRIPRSVLGYVYRPNRNKIPSLFLNSRVIRLLDFFLSLVPFRRKNPRSWIGTGVPAAFEVITPQSVGLGCCREQGVWSHIVPEITHYQPNAVNHVWTLEGTRSDPENEVRTSSVWASQEGDRWVRFSGS